jgi:hypothetical protein
MIRGTINAIVRAVVHTLSYKEEPVNPGNGGYRLLEDGSKRLLEDGVSFRVLE